jgi:hypothetical protein
MIEIHEIILFSSFFSKLKKIKLKVLKDLCFKLASLIPHHLLKPSKAFLVCEEARYDRNT